jgi:hypothetical protein
MAEEQKKRPSFFSEFKDKPALLLAYKYKDKENKLKISIFFSLIATIASAEVMIASLVGQKAFPNDPNAWNEFLTKALDQKIPHFTNGAIVGAIGLTVSLLVLIYLANKLWLHYEGRNNFQRRLGRGFTEGELEVPVQIFYKNWGIDPDIYTLTAEIEYDDPYQSTIRIGIPREEYDENGQCERIFEKLANERNLDKPFRIQSYQIKPISVLFNPALVAKWKTNVASYHKTLVAGSKKGLIISILVALASMEIMLASSIGQSAFPSAPNIVNSSLTHPLHSGHAHFTAGTLIGLVGLILSILAFMYFVKKLRNLDPPNVNTENSQIGDQKGATATSLISSN